TLQYQLKCLTLALLLSSPLRYVLSSDDSRLFQVTIPNSPPVSAVLGGSLILPCFVSSGRHAMFSLARVKWSKLSSDRETEILVAQGERMKVSELYKGRASLPGYASSSAELTLQLDGLRHNDTGFYRCEVQNGLEDAHALAQIKVKGILSICLGRAVLETWMAYQASETMRTFMVGSVIYLTSI
uniref:Ig-like domain-containing protein n=1 Tax=Electrophorus electricus TaxID=8005 RepID=A0A4W4G3M7_ELEEL